MNWDKIKRLALTAVYVNIYFFVKYLPPPIGIGLRWLVTKPFMKKMGSCRIMEGVTINYPENISIGRHCALGEYVFLSGYGGIEIGDNVHLGANTMIVSSVHPQSDFSDEKNGELIAGKVVIGNNVGTSAKVIITHGVTIGEYALIGAGTVVSEDVPPYTIVGTKPPNRKPIPRFDENFNIIDKNKS